VYLNVGIWLLSLLSSFRYFFFCHVKLLNNDIGFLQGSLIEMTGSKRGILMCSAVLIEFDMRIKMGEHEDDDLQLIDGALVCADQVYVPSIPNQTTDYWQFWCS
jgi:hypothetical protein